jgi:hypothetical protein
MGDSLLVGPIELEAPIDDSVPVGPIEHSAPMRDALLIESIEPPARPNTPTESDYSSDSTDDEDNSNSEDRAESDNELDISSDYTWSNETIQTEQDNDLVIDRVRSWVAGGLRPKPESQEVRALVSRWAELAVINGLLVRFRQGKSQVVLPYRLRQTVFGHMHASPLSVGNMGRDRTYRRLREKAWWPGYRSDVYEWMR